MVMDFIAGCIGGAAGVLVGHPLDTVKVRLQTQSPDNLKYRGTFHCLSTIARQESIAGLYKGIASPVCGVAAVNAVVFGVYGFLKPWISSPGNDSLTAHFMAGSVAGAVQSFIVSPMELVKTRMQLDESTSSKKPSSWDVLKGTFQKDGIRRGVFKGWGITLTREIPAFGFYFATYEALSGGGNVSTLEMLMAGGMAGVVSWVSCFPVDVIKTRLQSDVQGRYSGAMDCCRKTYAAEGYKAFTRGLTSTVIRAFPTNAATFTVVTWIMRLTTVQQDDLQNSQKQLEKILGDWDVARVKENISLTAASLHIPQSQYEYFNMGSQCIAVVQKTGMSNGIYNSNKRSNNILSGRSLTDTANNFSKYTNTMFALGSVATSNSISTPQEHNGSCSSTNSSGNAGAYENKSETKFTFTQSVTESPQEPQEQLKEPPMMINSIGTCTSTSSTLEQTQRSNKSPISISSTNKEDEEGEEVALLEATKAQSSSSSIRETQLSHRTTILPAEKVNTNVVQSYINISRSRGTRGNKEKEDDNSTYAHSGVSKRSNTEIGNNSNNTTTSTDSYLSTNIFSSWIADNLASLNFCTCPGDHCVCVF